LTIGLEGNAQYVNLVLIIQAGRSAETVRVVIKTKADVMCLLRVDQKSVALGSGADVVKLIVKDAFLLVCWRLKARHK